MRKRIHKQAPLMQAPISHERARELAAMSAILDRMTGILGPIRKELSQGRNPCRGRVGMTAEQVLRCLIIKQLNGFSYEALSFHLADSTCYRIFCRLGAFDRTPSKSTLQENIKRLSPQTMERVSVALLEQAQAAGIEDGGQIRVDCTVTESNIHEPADSSLLWDVTRKLTTLMKRSSAPRSMYSDHHRQAKRRYVAIQNAGKMEARRPLYRDLIAVATTACEDASRVAAWLKRHVSKDRRQRTFSEKLAHFEALGRRVIDQTQRRVFQDESVPSPEKVVSIFEEHTDIIVKGRREVEYGHKICLSTGVSGLITDCVVEKGNPADVTLAVGVIDRHVSLFGQAPEQVALDGGFASKANLSALKDRGVRDVAFSKRCGMKIKEMVRSETVYKALRHFRAGIEGVISFLKRVVGLERCTWSGLSSFHAFVLGSVATANLLILARHELRR